MSAADEDEAPIAPTAGVARRTEGHADAASPGTLRAPSAQALREALRAAGHEGVALHLFDELPSTSRWLVDRLGGADAPRPPALCAVDLQSAGQGRRGRTWVSLRGNVAFSLLERLPLPPARLGGLSLVTGIAAATVLRESSGLDVGIKWPNDLLVGDAKLGGLLTELQACRRTDAVRGDAARGVGRDPATHVVSGIGINVVRDGRVATLGIGGTSLAAAGAAPLDRDALVGRIAVRVLDAHARFVTSGWAAFADEWRAFDRLAGRDVIILDGNGNGNGSGGGGGGVRGRALGVNADGALRVRVAGVERALYGGEVSIRPATPVEARG